MTQPLIPSLWFHTQTGQLQTVIGYYQAIFAQEFTSETIIPLGETPSGNCEMCQVSFFQQPYSFLSTSKEHHPFNDALSLIINCKDQAEIDKYWDYFTHEGKPSQCGWCIDKFGLRWQIIPQNLGELMSNPGAGEVMMKQTKIVIDEYLRG